MRIWMTSRVGNFISESAASAVVRGSATTVTCKATIPYSWALASAAQDSISMSYTHYVPGRSRHGGG